MKRARTVGSHASHDRWLVSYADFITLLFAFFVVLYASAEMDKKKIARLSAAIEGGFQQLGAFAKNPSPGKPEGAPEAAGLPEATSLTNLPSQTESGASGLV